MCVPCVGLISVDFRCVLLRVLVYLVVEEMRVVICPVPLSLPGAETQTSTGEEKTGLKELKVDMMETIGSW